jgi:glycosyltransferase involved in cell wall biosynthesis
MSDTLSTLSRLSGSRFSQDNRPEFRVLQIFHVLSMGGAEKWLVALLEWFAANATELPVRLRFDICLTSGQSSIFDERVRELGARLHYIRYGRHELATFAWKFRRLLVTNQYHVIHDHADFAGGLHFVLGLGRLPRSRIIHVHNPVVPMDLTWRQSILRSVGQASVRRLATAVAGTSTDALADAGYPVGSNARQIRIPLHCGFDTGQRAFSRELQRDLLRREFLWEPQTRVLLFVGRLESNFNQKNPQFALDVVKVCSEADANVRALFIGAGDEMRAALEARVAEWGLSEKIFFLGIRHDVAEKMSGSDLLLFPSIAEGLGMVVVESQASGLRVLASDTTPKECAVVPGMVTFKSLDESPSEWALTALDILGSPAPDPDQTRSLVSASPFAIEHSARALLRLYGVPNVKVGA